MLLLLSMVAALTNPGQVPAVTPTTPTVSEPATVAALPPVTDADFVVGNADAPVTVVVYTSFVCEPCGAWWTQVLPTLIERHIATGEARLVLRMMPTTPRQISYVAAAIAMCAAADHALNVAGALFEGQPAMVAGSPIAGWYQTGINSSGRLREEDRTLHRRPGDLGCDPG